jgi:hypothetical protein
MYGIPKGFFEVVFALAAAGLLALVAVGAWGLWTLVSHLTWVA